MNFIFRCCVCIFSAIAGWMAAGAEAPVVLEAVEVSTTQEAFYNSIDRKVYRVGQDIQSATGSASDLLQNIPSVQVDVEGEVSLRGDSGVNILVNGKSVAAMNGDDRAAALEQMSASRIERVEVITSPSARYSPEGTAGIINFVLKDEEAPGYFASTRVNVGNEGRYNASLSANMNRGQYNLRTGLSLRQDERSRLSAEERLHFDAAGDLRFSTQRDNSDRTRPWSQRGELGFDYQWNDRTDFSTSLEYSGERTTGDGVRTQQTRDAQYQLTEDLDRRHHGVETEREWKLVLGLDHDFAQRGRTLALALSYESARENETEDLTTVRRLPTGPDEQESTRARNEERELELNADYAHPLADGAKLETGYALEGEFTDTDFTRRQLDPATNLWRVDTATTNRFVHESDVHALYATYGRPLGKFGFLGGLRFEHTFTTTDQRTARIRDRHDYSRLYPSLHLSYELAEAHRLQFGYSHRVNRPDGDDLNPYPRFDDPLEVEMGNPALEPEDTHTLETGYEYHRDSTSYLATIYHRQRYGGVTDVTQLVGGDTLVTRPENLSTNASSGLELGGTWRVADRGSLAVTFNGYRNQIDARNLGFVSRRTAYTWDAKVNAQWNASDALTLQFTSGYTGRRLTPQGERYPSFVGNLGARYTFKDRRTAVVLTVSDLFASLRNRTRLDTPLLRSDVTQRRSSRIVYLGLVYSFGGAGRSSEADMEFDESIE